MEDISRHRRTESDQQHVYQKSDFGHPPSPTEWDRLMDSSPSSVSPTTMRVAVRELLETAIYILLVFVIVRSLVQNFKIEGSSMEPSLDDDQYILVNKLVYFNFDLNAPLRWLPGQEDLEPELVYPLGHPQRGDVVVFGYPPRGEVRKDYIKRVIGLPGETVEISDGHVYINGELLDEPYLEGRLTHCSSTRPCDRGPIVVPPDTVFVMGDNRENSSDSREWDALPLDRIIGQAWVVYYPIDEWQVIAHPSYAAEDDPEPAPTE
jgi:signal peptidase I